MKIPEKVKILYKSYRIQEQKNLHEGDDDLYGQIQYVPQLTFDIIKTRGVVVRDGCDWMQNQYK